MMIRTKGFATSTGGQEDQELVYVYCTDETGYCLSLSWFPGDELAEVMVIDQVNYKTPEVAVALSPCELRVNLSPGAAAHLDEITEYVVPLNGNEKELRELDAALSVIFEGGKRGSYVRRF